MTSTADIILLSLCSVALVFYAVVWFSFKEQDYMKQPTNDTSLTYAVKFQLSANATMEACKAGLVGAGAIFPILFTVQAAGLQTSSGSLIVLSPEALVAARWATIWIGLSLLAGILNLARFPTIIPHTTLLGYDRWTGFIGFFQFLALAAGAIRILYFLVSPVFSG